MSKHWVREELHKDHLASWVDRLVSWIRRNREYLGGAVITLAVAGALGAYFVSRASKIKEESWNKYFVAQQMAYVHKPEESLKLLNEIASSFKGTDAAAHAALFKGDLLFELARYKEAQEAYSAFPSSYKPLREFAQLGALMAQNAGGDYPGAIAQAQQFLNSDPESPLAPQAYITLARSYSALGNAKDAQETYKKIAALYPDTVWSELVKHETLTQKK